jgi:hypothetical protein
MSKLSQKVYLSYAKFICISIGCMKYGWQFSKVDKEIQGIVSRNCFNED